MGDRSGTDPSAIPATVEFINAGHLLGSAYARVRVGDRTILFGGDLGRYGRPVLPDPSPVDAADVLLLESTYGDRVHESDDNGDRLAAIVNDTATRGGKLVDGGRERKLHGRVLPVAARIERIDSMSAHADAVEIMRWLWGFSRPPRMTHLVHGEPAALQALATRITAERGWPVHIA